MKNKFFFSLLLAIMFIWPGMKAFTQKVSLNHQPGSEFVITENTYTKLRVSSTVASYDHFLVKTKQGNFSLVTSDGFGLSNIEGDPQVPVMRQLIEIPVDADFQVNIISKNVITVNLSDITGQIPLIPAQPPVSKSVEYPEDLPFIYNTSTYNQDEFLYANTVKIIPIGTMRSVNLAILEIYPFQYNPVSNTMKIIDQIEIEISFTGNITQTLENKKKYFSPYHEGSYSFISNYKQVDGKELIMDEPATYVIVSSPLFQSALQPFIEWKVKKGFKVIEAYTNDPNVGTTTISIKNYLQGLYTNPPVGVNPPSFVLFVGDVAQIPVFSGTAGSHVTDLYYCEYTGDKIPEVYYGRFSANNTTELQPQIDKTLEYEQYLMPNPAFLDEVVMVAGADGSFQTHSNGQIYYGTENYFNAAHGLLSHTYLQPEPSGGNYSALIKQNVSNGVSYANYTAHCSSSGWANPSFVISDIPALQNNHKYCLMVGNCCLSVKFEGTCFGEEMLRAANKGALGYIGGSNNTYWDEDYWWGVGYKTVTLHPPYSATSLGAYDRTFHDHGEPLSEWYVTQGQMVVAGNLAVQQSGSSRITYYWEIYHLMGDPSLMVYYSQAPVTYASYQPLMPLASTSFTVNTEPYAYVAISKDGVLHGAAVANATGEAIVTLDPITVPGNADVVVTRQNGQPYIGTVVVASPTGPYVLLDSYQLDDAAGNNNGLADYGEQVSLNVTLKNLGNSMATNLVAALISTDPYITITDNTNNWPSIPSGGTSTENAAFSFTVAQDVPDQHLADFSIEVTNGTETWISTFSVNLNAPVISIGTISVSDVTGGNGNGRLDPGETAQLTIVASNTGHAASPAGNSLLTSTSPWITINSGSFDFAAIASGASVNTLFEITVDATTPIGTPVDLENVLTAGLFNASKTFTMSVGLILEDWESGNFTRFPWLFAGNANWSITNQAPYEGIYSAKSGTITHSQTTDLKLTLQTLASGSLSFYRKVSSESGYDYLEFWVDGTRLDRWAGEVDWSQVSYNLDPGSHEFIWRYMKDGSVSSGSDCAWIDYIVFPAVETSPVLTAGTLVVNDASGGNGNGILEPGETAGIVIPVTNTGLSAAMNVEGCLNSTSPYLSITSGICSIGTIEPAATLNGSFTVTLSSSMPAGAIVDLMFAATGTNAVCQKNYYLMTGSSTAMEDFETGNFLKFPWQLSGNANWTIANTNQYQGIYCAKSGTITHSQSSHLSITLDVMSAGDIKFFRKISSESNYDYLRFYIDNVEIDKWSGTVAWGQKISSLSAGTHIIKFSYTKDGSVSSGSDCAWLDNIEFPSTAKLVNVNFEVLLEGPFNGSTLNNQLQTSGYLPLSHPYSNSPWNYPGYGTVTTIPAGVVDWVLVQIRKASGGPGNANASTIVAEKAGFLCTDGKISDLDGISPLQFMLASTADLYAVVLHRNHLGIMSSITLTESAGVINYQFWTGSGQVYNGASGYKELIAGKWGMVSGDGNGDGQVSATDKINIWKVQAGASGYLSGDFNMNGPVNNEDKIMFWYPNSGFSSQVP